MVTSLYMLGNVILEIKLKKLSNKDMKNKIIVVKRLRDRLFVTKLVLDGNIITTYASYI